MITVTDVKVRIPNNTDKIAGFSDIVLNEGFCVKNIKIINGSKGIFISMPSIKDKDGNFNNICYPIDKDNRKEIENAVLNEYKKVANAQPTDKASKEIEF